MCLTLPSSKAFSICNQASSMDKPWVKRSWKNWEWIKYRSMYSKPNSFKATLMDSVNLCGVDMSEPSLESIVEIRNQVIVKSVTDLSRTRFLKDLMFGTGTITNGWD
ncbi:hypothetical protein WICPIJ_001450 [Wickerhamomyces pijperi]|uniref:Uncharacterized protein n=1 Tax=Wickerhamomyces pijperi TaxID=599730 RepID=A0A9P8QDB1_WICPI|nr:hypothetical protein WICPIJ_001450 [Wickerhamomyces pijperi]